MAQAQLPSFTISYGDLCRQLSSIPNTITWCKQKNLLPSEKRCICGRDCRIVKRSSFPEGECFRCPRKGCQKVTSLRSGTFFENSKVPLEKIIRLIHLWSTITPLNVMMKELQVKNVPLIRIISLLIYLLPFRYQSQLLSTGTILLEMCVLNT